jgi:hypothetical protein|nr:MAG TPA: hypothetical protein [Caudoviricetes sp.]
MNDFFEIINDLKAKLNAYKTVFGCVKNDFFNYCDQLSIDITKCKDPEIKKMLEKRLNELGSAIKKLDL